MKTFELKNNFIKIAFVVDDNNKIKVNFFGNETNFINKESTFVECEISEDNHMGTHCSKQVNTPYSSNCIFDGYQYVSNNELVIKTHNEFMEIDTHFIIYDNNASISSFNVIKNITNNNINIEYISSFYLYGLGQKDNLIHEDMFVHYASNTWHTEAQWHRISFFDVDLFNANKKTMMKRFVLNNTGSWSTKEYLPMIGVENARNKQFILGQVENNGSWHIEMGDHQNQFYLSLCGPEFFDNSCSIRLKPNETFTSVQATISIGEDFESALSELTKTRRNLLSNSINFANYPIVYNDFMHYTWDLSKEEFILPLVDETSKLGVDVFCIDAGWFYPQSGWPDYIGDWVISESNYPNLKLKGVIDYIHNKGMKAGLWFEIENIGIKSLASKTLPRDYFIQVNDTPVIKNSRYCLNLANKEAFSWAINTIEKYIKELNLDYIKLDYNLDSGSGNELGYSSVGEGLLENNRAVIKLIDQLYMDYPNIIVETCASGGLRMDFETLKHSSIQSTSDLEDYRYYPYITSNVMTACLPEQAANWCYPVCNDADKSIAVDDNLVVYTMSNGILGRMCLASRLNKLSEHQKDLVKEAINVNKALKSFKITAIPAYPNGICRYFDKYVVVGLRDSKRMILSVFNSSNSSQTVTVDLKKYKAMDVKILYPSCSDIKYEFAKDSMILIVYFTSPYSAINFDISLDLN